MRGIGVDPMGSSTRCPGSEHRERQQGRPPFRLPCQARGTIGRQPQPQFATQPDGLMLVHRQFRGTDLEQGAVRAPAGEREADPNASRDGHRRPFGQMLHQLREDVEARTRGDPVRVVDGDPDGHRGSGHRCQQSPDDGPVRHPVRRDRAEELRTERFVAIDCRREIRQKHDRVAVNFVGRQPGDRGGVFRRPLGQEARLAVTGRRDDRDDRIAPGLT